MAEPQINTDVVRVVVQDDMAKCHEAVMTAYRWVYKLAYHPYLKRMPVSVVKLIEVARENVTALRGILELTKEGVENDNFREY